MYSGGDLDWHSRTIVGWAMKRTLDCQLAMDALSMAVVKRRAAPAILHSDQGSTYATAHYRALLQSHAIRQSMSRKGNCWDNAPMESFFHTLKTELVMHCDYQTRAQARASLFEYLEVFYNRQRGPPPLHKGPPYPPKTNTQLIGPPFVGGRSGRPSSSRAVDGGFLGEKGKLGGSNCRPQSRRSGKGS